MEDPLSGMPRYQIAYARRLGFHKSEEISAFVLANSDQPDSFWLGSTMGFDQHFDAPRDRDAVRVQSGQLRTDDEHDIKRAASGPAGLSIDRVQRQWSRAPPPIPDPSVLHPAPDSTSVLSTEVAVHGLSLPPIFKDMVENCLPVASGSVAFPGDCCLVLDGLPTPRVELRQALTHLSGKLALSKIYAIAIHAEVDATGAGTGRGSVVFQTADDVTVAQEALDGWIPSNGDMVLRAVQSSLDRAQSAVDYYQLEIDRLNKMLEGYQTRLAEATESVTKAKKSYDETKTKLASDLMGKPLNVTPSTEAKPMSKEHFPLWMTELTEHDTVDVNLRGLGIKPVPVTEADAECGSRVLLLEANVDGVMHYNVEAELLGWRGSDGTTNGDFAVNNSDTEAQAQANKRDDDTSAERWTGGASPPASASEMDAATDPAAKEPASRMQADLQVGGRFGGGFSKGVRAGGFGQVDPAHATGSGSAGSFRKTGRFGGRRTAAGGAFGNRRSQRNAESSRVQEAPAVCHVKLIGVAKEDGQPAHAWVNMSRVEHTLPGVSESEDNMWLQARVQAVGIIVQEQPDFAIKIDDWVSVPLHKLENSGGKWGRGMAANAGQPPQNGRRRAFRKVAAIDHVTVTVKHKGGLVQVPVADVSRCIPAQHDWPRSVTVQIIDPTAIPNGAWKESFEDGQTSGELAKRITLTISGTWLTHTIAPPGTRCQPWHLDCPRGGVALSVSSASFGAIVPNTTGERVTLRIAAGHCAPNETPSVVVPGTIISESTSRIMAIELPSTVPSKPMSHTSQSARHPWHQQRNQSASLSRGLQQFLRQEYAFLIHEIDVQGEPRKLVKLLETAFSEHALISGSVVVEELSEHVEDVPALCLLVFFEGFNAEGVPDQVSAAMECAALLQSAETKFSVVPRSDVEHVRIVPTKCFETDFPGIERDGKKIILAEIEHHTKGERLKYWGQILKNSPQKLVGLTATKVSKPSLDRPNLKMPAFKILAISNNKLVGQGTHEQLGLFSSSFQVVPNGMIPSCCLRPAALYFRECAVCDRLCTEEDFATFCYRTFRVTPHGSDARDPRHSNTICNECFKQHCSLPILEGKLYVPCPAEGCGRSLQTLELQDTLSPNLYAQLVTSLREMESASGEESVTDGTDGLELKLCPQCQARIEKNEGCSSMMCYRCGHGFDWSTAQSLTVRKQAPSSNFTYGSSFSK